MKRYEYFKSLSELPGIAVEPKSESAGAEQPESAEHCQVATVAEHAGKDGSGDACDDGRDAK